MYEVIYLTFVNVMHFRFMFIPLKILSRLYSSANPYSSKTYIYFHSFECSNELIRQRNISLSLSMYFQMQKSSRHLFVIQTLSLQQYILYKVCTCTILQQVGKTTEKDLCPHHHVTSAIKIVLVLGRSSEKTIWRYVIWLFSSAHLTYNIPRFLISREQVLIAGSVKDSNTIRNLYCYKMYVQIYISKK